MKLKLKYLIPILIVSLIAWLSWQVQGKIQEKEAIESKRSQLPDFQFQTLDGKLFSRDHLASDRPVVVMFIHPECPHCQYEAEALYNQKDEHEYISWVLVSEAGPEQLKGLDQSFHLTELPNVHLLRAELGGFYRYFGSEVVPSTFLYDVSGKLIKYYRGEVKLAAIYAHLPNKINENL